MVEPTSIYELHTNYVVTISHDAFVLGDMFWRMTLPDLSEESKSATFFPDTAIPAVSCKFGAYAILFPTIARSGK